MTKNNPTSKEHYIPQVYLNGFASKDKRIYFYDLNIHRYSDQMVPVKSICYQKDLYEYKNEKNEIININRIEKALGGFESAFSEKKAAIKSRIKVANNQTNSFLSQAEKDFWTFYITLQILRMPKIINESSVVLSKLIPDGNNANMNRNTALSMLLPFEWKNDLDKLESTLFIEIFTSVLRLECAVAYDEQKRLFTSDNPLYIYSTNSIYDCNEIYFPIDSSLCLIFSNSVFLPENGIIHIDYNEYCKICKSIAYAADEKLYTQRKLTKIEMNWIDSARNDKKNDKEAKQKLLQ